MQIVQYNTNIIEEYIALDELLLKKAEKGEIGETIRFWRSSEYCVVVGRSVKVLEDCFFKRCNKDNIKVIRRISGGRTILQGVGCFNYSVILSYKRSIKLKNIQYSFNYILDRISKKINNFGFNTKVLPISDISIDNKKFSGNAQARKHNFFLQHGTFLYNFDLEKVSLYLKHPPIEPDYRKNRQHEKFLTNISLTDKKIQDIILEIFPYNNVYFLNNRDLKELKRSVYLKYNKKKWNYMF